jgi:hypothetical protein
VEVEVEKEVVEEKVTDIEEESFVKQNYSRSDEDPQAWELADLAVTDPDRFMASLNFYALSSFSVYKNIMREDDMLSFPANIFVSRNYFNKAWMLLRKPRRLKNVICVLEWTPAGVAMEGLAKGLTAPAAALEKELAERFTQPATATLVQRCFKMFDSDGADVLSSADMKKVSYLLTRMFA